MGRAAPVLAWGLLLAVGFATLAPVGLRPLTPFGPTAERFGAFLLIGFVFAIAYPRHILLVGLLVIGAAALLEAAQLLIATRHGTGRDLVVKFAGAAFGLAAGRLVAVMAGRRKTENTG